jgi:hypothetical protein
MSLRRLLCGVRGHRYRYAGILLGQALECCSRCQHVRAR